MEEKKLTDEEIVKAYKYCVLDDGNCDDCPYKVFGCCIDGHEIIDIIKRQKAEIERLTRELGDTISMNEVYVEKVRENTELQKQVDDLKDERENMQAEIIATEELRLQAVKDTAKEILTELLKEEFFEIVYFTDENGDIRNRQVIRIEKIKDIAEKYGVEVEK